jgi:hypothetical protein
MSGRVQRQFTSILVAAADRALFTVVCIVQLWQALVFDPPYRNSYFPHGLGNADQRLVREFLDEHVDEHAQPRYKQPSRKMHDVGLADASVPPRQNAH